MKAITPKKTVKALAAAVGAAAVLLYTWLLNSRGRHGRAFGRSAARNLDSRGYQHPLTVRAGGPPGTSVPGGPSSVQLIGAAEELSRR
ncbi:hypothetical protein [Mycobacterium genavense]|uniref:hypothetical protein n=1 Tax=Mycobacterium genavense TaxID=36812 RepID=UPI0012EB1450|nr:hypothetical protein [Mycobacterium genavense]